MLKLASENAWGYTRIFGELKRLCVGTICRTTVLNILREAGFDPGPKRGVGTWSDYIKIHAETLYACDFFTKNVWTIRGLKRFYILAFIHIDSRKVYVSSSTTNPNSVWVNQQAANFVEQLGSLKPVGMKLLRDNDGKFQGGFDARLAELGVEVKPISPRAPNQNAYIERWIKTLQNECLDYFTVLGQDHLEYLVGDFVDYYNNLRPHQNKRNRPLPASGQPEPPVLPFELDQLECHSRLGGLLKHYSRKAA